MEAFGLSDIYCILSLSRADEVIVDDWNQLLQRHTSKGTLLGDQIGRVVGPVGLHEDILAPSPLLSNL